MSENQQSFVSLDRQNQDVFVTETSVTVHNGNILIEATASHSLEYEVTKIMCEIDNTVKPDVR